jgi:hypothetical protein
MYWCAFVTVFTDFFFFFFFYPENEQNKNVPSPQKRNVRCFEFSTFHIDISLNQCLLNCLLEGKNTKSNIPLHENIPGMCLVS